MDLSLHPTISTHAAVGLFLAFTVKHLLADYVLQTETLVRGKEGKQDWLGPLCAHAGVHAGGTLLVVLAFSPSFWWVAVVDFAVHGAIDRAKSVIGRYGSWAPHEARFWWLHGTDQAAHHLTHFTFVLVMSGAFRAG